MKILIFSIVTLFVFSFAINAQNVNIPDANFKAALVANLAINTNGDGEIQVSEANSYPAALNVSQQNISDLTGIEEFTSIFNLNCGQNPLTNVDLSNNIALTSLTLNFTQITTLDVSALVNLTFINCSDNALVDIDLSSNTSLTNIRVYNNALTSCNVKNGNNSNVTLFRAQNNPNLTCIEVDNVAYSTSNWTDIDATASFSVDCSVAPCIVNIPDANFKAFLVGNTGINTNSDTEIQCSEASAVIGLIDCSGQTISDLTGIEAFTAMKFLYCYNNSLTNLDLSSNTSLKELRCYSNDLTSVNVSQNVDLQKFNCSMNALTSLDVSSNTNLTELYCFSNSLTTLDITNNANLTTLQCFSNALTSLNVLNNTSLEYLYCYNNSLSNLDVSNNTNLIQLQCYSNNLNSLDLSNNINLTEIRCQDNSLTSLDVSNVTSLVNLYCHTNAISNLDLSNNNNLSYLQCQSNSLNSLNVANGNNTNFTFFYVIDNPNLTCINVDDATYSTTNWTDIDAIASFSESCSFVSVDNVNDFKVSIYPNPSNELVTFKSDKTINNIEIYNLAGQKVQTVNNQKTINIGSLPKGVYTAKLIMGDSSPIIKQLIKN